MLSNLSWIIFATSNLLNFYICRPQSAITAKEKEHKMNLALLKMSAATTCVIEEAIGRPETKQPHNESTREKKKLLNEDVTDEKCQLNGFSFEGKPNERSPATRFEEYYEGFERTPSRPTSGKKTRPSSAKDPVNNTDKGTLTKNRPSSAVNVKLKTSCTKEAESKSDRHESESKIVKEAESKAVGDTVKKEVCYESSECKPESECCKSSQVSGRPQSEPESSKTRHGQMSDRRLSGWFIYVFQCVLKPN